MGPSYAAVRDLGVGLEHSPMLTELRLPSRLGCVNAVGLGFVGIIVVLGWVGFFLVALKRPEGWIGPVVLSSLVAVALFFGLYHAMRWMRYGVKVSVTPERLVVKRHWTNGGDSLETYLNQVRLEETGREIVVAAQRKKMKIGSGLTPEARRAVVEFLTEVIAAHLHVEDKNSREASGAGDHAAAGAGFVTWAGLSMGEPVAVDPRDSEAFDPLALALCLRFRGCDAGQAHLAPGIPQAVLVSALQGYLDLQDDEVLLAIVGVARAGSAGMGCALTTKRLYWPGAAAKSPGPRPPRCQSLDYSSLPETIGETGSANPAVDLGEGRRIWVGATKANREALVAFLRAIRTLARGEAPGPEISERDRALAQTAWPRVVDAGAAARALQAEIRTFHGRALVVSRARVTPAIILACVGIYVAMVATGVPILNPKGALLYAWGANFGPAVVFDHQAWRLFTSMFLHFGLIHLLMNMYCLAMAGPLVERFFGHFGFAALYVLSGLGGSIASLWVHPTAMSAGASGAIFGIFGALLGYLAIRHREVPTAVLKPLRAGAVAFVGYNTAFALFIPQIDMAAHIGGLASGFVCGLLLTAVGPTQTRDVRGLALALRRSGIVAVVAVALAGLGLKGIDFARDRILADAKIGGLIKSQLNAAPAWEAFSRAADPVIREFDRIGAEINQVNDQIEKGDVPAARIIQTLDRLKTECKALGVRIPTIRTESAEIQEIVNHLASAQARQLEMLTALDRIVATGDESQVTGPGGYIASTNAYEKEWQEIGSLRDAYFKAHGLQSKPAAE
jgi:rhomboid protease GluP